MLVDQKWKFAMRSVGFDVSRSTGGGFIGKATETNNRNQGRGDNEGLLAETLDRVRDVFCVERELWKVGRRAGRRLRTGCRGFSGESWIDWRIGDSTAK